MKPEVAAIECDTVTAAPASKRTTFCPDAFVIFGTPAVEKSENTNVTAVLVPLMTGVDVSVLLPPPPQPAKARDILTAIKIHFTYPTTAPSNNH